MRIAFYAPLKGPDHPVPSGDRQMARLLIEALRAGGHDVTIASTLRSFLARPDPDLQAEVERAAVAEVLAIDTAWSVAGVSRPDVWFTYHPFYKAPDLVGPAVARRFGIPYATAEASNAPKRAAGPWASWHGFTEAALKAAAVHVCFTDQDREGLERLLGSHARITALPPFIDAAPFSGGERSQRPGRVTLVAVAMMRMGDKMRSFGFLSEALARVPRHFDWHLAIVGDGPVRAEVEAAFAPLGPGRVSFLGLLDVEAVGAVLRGADLYVWPGFNEAYGVAYLEAGAAGLPVLAMRCGGIPSVVNEGETGVLVDEGDLDAFAQALARLIGDDALRARLGAAGQAFVTRERTVSHAAEVLNTALVAAIRSRPHAATAGTADDAASANRSRASVAAEAAWDALEAELDRAGAEARTVTFWLRDDDAIAVTPALERLERICSTAKMPVLLAVIPAAVTPELGAWIEDHPAFTPCQHGYAHANHAPAGARACELGGARPLDAVEGELRRGRERLKTLFGPRLSDCLVPPWNRIDPALIPRLSRLGFDRLSVFGPLDAAPDAMPRLNADLDIIDWRHGRVGRPLDDVARKLAALIAQARQHGRPIGLLTHHLAHDETAWGVLEVMLGRLGADPRVAFASATSL